MTNEVRTMMLKFLVKNNSSRADSEIYFGRLSLGTAKYCPFLLLTNALRETIRTYITRNGKEA